ncbi:alpha/beta fold hydrolase [Pseudonocardia sp. ICBG601]|uniref:alpha/beta fold hydrolase n=1 Tax=Pseudonocardia sp. ICBG601 TaxID=2846759 RepID=UPI0021F52D30|nr:alpha/beta hydrolase [Pseudonocardia sp. ICBG601]
MASVAERLGDEFYVVVPDLRGFGASDKHLRDPGEYYSLVAQARSVAGLIEELGLSQSCWAVTTSAAGSVSSSRRTGPTCSAPW